MMNRKDMVKVADESVEGANIYKSKIGMLYIEDSNGCLRILNQKILSKENIILNTAILFLKVK